MLKRLEIKNFVLIDSLEINFEDAFNIITGETGAGKSILLGALGLLMGDRADKKTVRDDAKKCIIEGEFWLKDDYLKAVFESYELDFEKECIIRRELTDKGKSRCFVNDTPVNLAVLKTITHQLLDIHSQHENMLLTKDDFQLKILDLYADASPELESYQTTFTQYKKLIQKREELKEINEKSKIDQDYLSFQLNELLDADLKAGELKVLEEELEVQSNAEEIKEVLSLGSSMFNDENGGVSQITQFHSRLKKLAGISKEVDDLLSRLTSMQAELDDISYTLNGLEDKFEADGERLAFLNSRVDLINGLMVKHRKQTDQELIQMRDEIDLQIQQIDSLDDQILQLDKEIASQERSLLLCSQDLSLKRKKSGESLSKAIIKIAKRIGLKEIDIVLSFEELKDFQWNGKDQVNILFSANKGLAVQPIASIASGGELSRVMLAIKSILASKATLPTIVFDEIDTGISGDVADKMGDVLKEMSDNMQLICITHLPQIAAKGKAHYKVFKYVKQGMSQSSIKQLKEEERVEEIAGMLSGSKLSEAAILNAKELLQ